MSRQEPVRVLIADDDPLILATLGGLLRKAGFEVLEASNGAKALELCRTRLPGLAIIDHRMPELSGLELARSIADSSEIPVVFLSAYSDDSIVREAVAAGAMTYLVKPVDTEQLLPIIRAVLQRARELRALRAQTGQLSAALQMGRTISVAIGMIMEKFHVDQEEGLERLRIYARSQRRRLEDVALELLQASDNSVRLFNALSASSAQAKRPHQES